jgi:hypothetical protein
MQTEKDLRDLVLENYQKMVYEINNKEIFELFVESISDDYIVEFDEGTSIEDVVTFIEESVYGEDLKSNLFFEILLEAKRPGKASKIKAKIEKISAGKKALQDALEKLKSKKESVPKDKKSERNKIDKKIFDTKIKSSELAVKRAKLEDKDTDAAKEKADKWKAAAELQGQINDIDLEIQKLADSDKKEKSGPKDKKIPNESFVYEEESKGVKGKIEALKAKKKGLISKLKEVLGGAKDVIKAVTPEKGKDDGNAKSEEIDKLAAEIETLQKSIDNKKDLQAQKISDLKEKTDLLVSGAITKLLTPLNKLKTRLRIENRIKMRDACIQMVNNAEQKAELQKIVSKDKEAVKTYEKGEEEMLAKSNEKAQKEGTPEEKEQLKKIQSSENDEETDKGAETGAEDTKDADAPETSGVTTSEPKGDSEESDDEDTDTSTNADSEESDDELGSDEIETKTPKEEKPKTETPKEEKPKTETPKEEKPKTETPKEEKPKTEPKAEVDAKKTLLGDKLKTVKDAANKEEDPKKKEAILNNAKEIEKAIKDLDDTPTESVSSLELNCWAIEAAIVSLLEKLNDPNYIIND